MTSHVKIARCSALALLFATACDNTGGTMLLRAAPRVDHDAAEHWVAGELHSVQTLEQGIGGEAGLHTIGVLRIDRVLEGRVDEREVVVQSPGGDTGDRARIVTHHARLTPGSGIYRLRRGASTWRVLSYYPSDASGALAVPSSAGEVIP